MPGQWLVVVWRGDAGHVFAPGHYLETRPARCGELDARELVTTLPLREHMAGGGLFDLDDALVALVLPCNGRLAALSLESVTRGLSLGRSVEGRLLALYGLRAQPLGEAARAFLGVEQGALVSEVWTGYPADRGGVRPGDVITAIGERPVSNPEDLQVLLTSPDVAGWAVSLWRARRRIEDRLKAPAPTSGGPEGAASLPAGLRLEPPAAGFPIATVAPGSAAAEGGIQPGDRLLRIDFVVPRTAAEVARALARADGGPTFVEVERGARRFGVLLPGTTAR
jgi:S1-C subfamily serine protease